MKLNFHPTSRAAMLALAVVSSAPALAAQSSAYAVSASFTTNGGPLVQLAPQLLTSGATTLGQSYDKPLSAPVLSKSVPLQPKQFRSPALTVLEQKVSTDAAGFSGIDNLGTSGTSSAAAGIVTLTLYPSMVIDPPLPLPATKAAPVVTDDASDVLTRPGFPALRVQFSKLKSTANFDQIFPRPSRRTGSTSVGELTLSGPLIGPKPLVFTGDIAPNTVAVNTPTVKIVLNAQSIPQQPVCDPGKPCPLYRVLETVETKAVLIELTNAPVLGHQVTGNIVIGDAQAGQ